MTTRYHATAEMRIGHMEGHPNRWDGCLFTYGHEYCLTNRAICGNMEPPQPHTTHEAVAQPHTKGAGRAILKPPYQPGSTTRAITKDTTSAAVINMLEASGVKPRPATLSAKQKDD